MADFYTRTELLLGKSGVGRLKAARVLLFGVGGVGGNCAEALVRAGIGGITIVDGDVYSESNLNRQNYSTTETVGLSKVDILRHELGKINPDCKIEAMKIFYSESNADMIDFSEYSYIVDAVDSVPSKMEIIQRANSAGVPVISSMGAGNKLDPTAFRVADIYMTKTCPLAKIMRKKCRENGIEQLTVVYSEEEPIDISANIGEDTAEAGKKTVGSVSFVPSVCGLVIAGHVIKSIAATALDK